MSPKRKINRPVLSSSTHRLSLYHRRYLLQLHFPMDLPLYPFCFEDVIRELPSWFESPGVCYAMLVLVDEGETVYRIDGRDFRLIPGRVLFVPEFHSFGFRSRERCHKYVLEIKGSRLTSILSSLGLERTELLDADSDTSRMIRELGWALDTPDQNSFLSLCGACYEILTRLGLIRRETLPRRSLLPRILEYLEQDTEKKLTLDLLAERVGIHRVALIRMVKKHIGLTPMQYRIARKMERAIYLLQIPSLSIKEISAQLGYCSQCYFTDEFRRHTGMAPRAYRIYQKNLPRSDR